METDQYRGSKEQQRSEFKRSPSAESLRQSLDTCCRIVVKISGEAMGGVDKHGDSKLGIDYKATSDLSAALMAAAPEGIDVYFENVGGAHLEAAINAANPFARMALCGMISQYNDTEAGVGTRNMIQCVGKSLRLEGFIVSNHWDMMPAFVKDLAEWHAAGKITWKQTVREGIENAPSAFLGLFAGENFGKMLVKLG